METKLTIQLWVKQFSSPYQNVMQKKTSTGLRVSRYTEIREWWQVMERLLHTALPKI
jgi:hypothetical protein